MSLSIKASFSVSPLPEAKGLSLPMTVVLATAAAIITIGGLGSVQNVVSACHRMFCVVMTNASGDSSDMEDGPGQAQPFRASVRGLLRENMELDKPISLWHTCSCAPTPPGSHKQSQISSLSALLTWLRR